MLTNWFEHQPSAQQQCLSTSMITMMDHIRTGKHTNSSCLLFSLSALSVIYLWTQRQGLTGPSLCRLTKSRSVTSLPSVSAVCALVYHRLCVWAQTFSHMTRRSHWKKDGYCARRCTATSLFFNWKFIQTYPNVSARGWSRQSQFGVTAASAGWWRVNLCFSDGLADVTHIQCWAAQGSSFASVHW